MNEMLVTGGISLLSSIVGASIAFVTQNLIVAKQIAHDKEKNEQALALQVAKEDKERRFEYIQLANEILRIDGEFLIIRDSRQGYHEFEESLYFKHIRPLIFSKFHLFDIDTRSLVREIDTICAIARHDEKLDRDGLEILVRNYNTIIGRMTVVSEYYPDAEGLPQ